MSGRHVYLVAVAAIFGCTSGGRTSDNPPILVGSRMARILSADEIAAAHADVNTAYDAVARLRPNWLAGHGVTSGSASGTAFAVVFVDGEPYGDLSSLRNIPAYHVGDIHYYDVTEAGARFGIRGGSSGVIEVRTKSPSSRT
ncbi:MAG TPA: hypothetical protein VF962_06880 [Gemmatimonadaceae bacterium]